MKNVKTIVITILALLTSFMQSCLEDDTTNETVFLRNGSFYAALGTVVTPSLTAGEAAVESDDEGIVYVMNPDMLTLNDANKEGQRIFYNYVETDAPSGKEKSKESFIEITDLLKILTKPIDFLEEGEEDVYGHDGIDIIFYNLCKNYLTLQFQILASGGNISHRISLVSNGEVPDDNGFLPLEFRHNAEGDDQNVTMPGYVSFLLTDAPGFREETLAGFKITYESINHGQQILTLTLSNDSKATPFPFMGEGSCNTNAK